MINALTTVDFIVSKIFFIRSEKVLLDFDLASLYGVETKRLKEAVRRNKGRFPEDFMFVLSTAEKGVSVASRGGGVCDVLEEGGRGKGMEGCGAGGSV